MPEHLYDSQTPVVAPKHHSPGISADSPQPVPIDTYFHQSCPTCGRRLLIPIKHLGGRVFCSHCRRRFVARDVSQDRGDAVDVGGSTFRRAEQLLALLESSSGNPRVGKG
jgi:hypothetical protein